MRKKADWRIRRPFILVAVAVVVLAAASAGAYAPGLLHHSRAATQAAVASGSANVSVIGEAAPVGAAAPAAVRPSAPIAPTSVHSARTSRPRQSLDDSLRSNRARTLAAADVSVDLCAVAGSTTMSDSTLIPIWGFAPMPATNNCDDATPQLPGPEIDAVAGNVVTLNVTNDIDGHTISLEAAGIDVDPSASTPDAPTDQTASITFTAGEGTYLYDSAGDSGRQQAMGLYGAIVFGSATPGQAYGVPVDAQRTLVLSEIDPGFNANPDGFDMNGWHPSRWLINGKDAPGSGPISAPPGALLLRYVNAGVDHNTIALLGLHERMLARDGFRLDNPYDVVSETFPAAETGDALVNIPASPSGTQFPLYNQNGKPGMTTFLQVP